MARFAAKAAFLGMPNFWAINCFFGRQIARCRASGEHDAFALSSEPGFKQVAPPVPAPHPLPLPAGGGREGPAAKPWEGEGRAPPEPTYPDLSGRVPNRIPRQPT